MIQQLIWSRINRQINSYVVKRTFSPDRKAIYVWRALLWNTSTDHLTITPIDFQTASVVSWENKGRLSQWVRNQAEVEKTATGANFSHEELEDYITFAGKPLKV